MIFHVVLWTETDTRITMSLGLEGPIANREMAERAVAAYRARVGAHPELRLTTRVGLLEISPPNPLFKGHPAPRTDIEQVLQEINARRL